MKEYFISIIMLVSITLLLEYIYSFNNKTNRRLV